MIKKLIPLLSTVLLLSLILFPIETENSVLNGVIKRLTESGNSTARFPCLNDLGDKVLYVLETDDGDQLTKSIQILDVETGKKEELFQGGIKSAPPPFSDSFLDVGTKPPIISGDGQIAVFSLSLGEPAAIPDHYLAVARTDGTSFKVFPFPIKALEEIDLESLEIKSPDWERLSYYSINNDGSRIACVVKGHLGPSKYGNPSGIIVLDRKTEEQNTLLAPDFVEKNWIWTNSPRRPLTGGGWGFGLSGNGQRIVFGAQSSTEKTDYDLYTIGWTGDNLTKITDFKDRWFSLVDISRDGHNILFYYTGQKEKAIGSYLLQESGQEITFLQTPTGSRIEFFDMSGNGNTIAYLQGYSGKILDIETGIISTAFDENTEGYAEGISPMDFPRYPSFWCPKILSLSGDRVLLSGFPPGRASPEIYMLYLEK
ncbi:hypothetical protein ACFLQZ_04115 [Acidobacteriota bacterium]